MAAPREPEAPPYKGSPDERFWYVTGGALGLLHLMMIGTSMILSGMIPSNDLCASSSIHTWTYWSLYGDKGLSIVALGWFYSLLWHTLWRWWYGPAFIFTLLCGALHTFCTIWYIQYNNACSSNLQCFGGCNPAPNPGASGYWIAWWTLTGVFALVCFLEAIVILGVGRFTTVQALLFWSYGSNTGPLNYYERFSNYYSSPTGLPYGAPASAPIGRSAPATQPLLAESREAPAGYANDLEYQIAQSKASIGTAIVGGGTWSS